MNRFLMILLGVFLCVCVAMQPAESQVKRKQRQKRVVAYKPATTGNSAVEVKLGVSMMYDWWEPAFLKIANGMTGNLFSRRYKSDVDGSIMLGPSIGIRIGNKWNITGTALLGCSRNQFRHSTLAMEASYLNLIVPDTIVNPYLDRGITEVRRYDADLNIERIMLKYLTVLFGARFSYQDSEGYAWKVSRLYSPISRNRDEYTAWYVGPSVGVGVYYEIKGFSISAGVSALFQFGFFSLERYAQNRFFYNFNFISDEFKIAHLSIGADCSVKLAYFIRRIRLELWVGGRYIILPHISLYDIDSAFNAVYNKGWVTGQVDHFRGLTWGVSYKF